MRRIFTQSLAACILLLMILTTTGCGSNNYKQHVQGKRVLALTPLMMENLFILGITPIGKVEEYTCRPEGVALTSIGRQRSINLETVESLQPDIIFAQTTFNGSIRAALEATGAKVYYLDSKSGVDLGILRKMAIYLDKTEKAEAYIKKINGLSQKIKAEMQAFPLKSYIILLDSTDKIYVYHPHSFHSEILSSIGLQNVVSEELPVAKNNSIGSAVSYDIETIIQQDPDLIFIRNSSATAAASDNILYKYYHNPLYSQLKAVKNKNIYVLPAEVNTGNISIENAMLLCARLVYPDISIN
ncbi:MAG: ABC transporter substrate-binding protein [Negativicutes bacterium]|nr:ABC transporter substrate-binding protein [Negativicutes bacterium]